MMDGAQVTDNELPNNKSESGPLEPLQLLIWGQSKFLSFPIKKSSNDLPTKITTDRYPCYTFLIRSKYVPERT